MAGRRLRTKAHAGLRWAIAAILVFVTTDGDEYPRFTFSDCRRLDDSLVIGVGGNAVVSIQPIGVVFHTRELNHFAKKFEDVRYVGYAGGELEVRYVDSEFGMSLMRGFRIDGLPRDCWLEASRFIPAGALARFALP